MSRMKDSDRIKMIAEYIKSNEQPDGYIIKEDKNGHYRVSKMKTQRQILEEKRDRLNKQLDEINRQLESNVETSN